MATLRAWVAGVFGAYYHVLPFEQNFETPSLSKRYKAKPRGKLRIEYREKNLGYNKLKESLLAIGDIVEVSQDAQNEDVMVIEAVHERKNAIHRASFGRQQCLAANIDGVVLLTSVRSPDFNLGFTERALAEAVIAGVTILLVVNKMDLVNALDEETQTVLDYYSKIQIPLFKESLLSGVSTSLKDALNRGTWLLLGQSGTGKSTLMNRLLGEEKQAVGEISQIEKGRHTTTNPILYYSEAHDNLALIDVPGLREFGMRHRDALEIRDGFPDFTQFACRFENCLHLNEPNCGVKEALLSNTLPDFRYKHYVSMLETIDEKFKPRKGDYWRGIK